MLGSGFGRVYKQLLFRSPESEWTVMVIIMVAIVHLVIHDTTCRDGYVHGKPVESLSIDLDWDSVGGEGISNNSLSSQISSNLKSRR